MGFKSKGYIDKSGVLNYLYQLAGNTLLMYAYCNEEGVVIDILYVEYKRPVRACERFY